MWCISWCVIGAPVQTLFLWCEAILKGLHNPSDGCVKGDNVALCMVVLVLSSIVLVY